jgi:hypothetical protein
MALFAGYWFAHQGNRQTTPDPVEHYRLPAATSQPSPSPIPVVRDWAPRAQLVYDHSAPRPVGEGFPVHMPDGQNLVATVRTPVAGEGYLPLSGNAIGDCRYVANVGHWFVWTTSAGSSVPAWIDP